MSAPENTFKAALKRGDQLCGCWAGFADPYPTEVLATAGFDWLVLDAEHAPNDLRTIMAQLQVLEGKPCHPVVRLPMGEAWAIKQVLDAGAQTLLIPMVDSADEARDLVRAMRYPPQGIRGSGAALARASRFSSVPDYITTANDQMCLLVQIESRAAVEALDDILAVEGVDGIFIGPSDLAASMGHPGNVAHPEVKSAVVDAIARISKAGLPPGILSLDPGLLQDAADAGAKFIAIGVDMAMLRRAALDARKAWS